MKYFNLANENMLIGGVNHRKEAFLYYASNNLIV